MFSNRELEEMRDAVADLLPDSCNLLTSTRVSDGQGGGTVTWGTAVRGVACRLDITSSREMLASGAVQTFDAYIFSIPYDETITTAYRIEHNSHTYAVSGVNNNISKQLVKRIRAERV